MNFSLALSQSTNTLAFPISVEGVAGSEAAGSEGVDEFAVLLNSFAAMVPDADQAAKSVEGRQAEGLPSGKILPLSGSELPVDLAGHDELSGSGDAINLPPLASARVGVTTPVLQAPANLIDAAANGGPVTLTPGGSASKSSSQHRENIPANAKTTEQKATEAKQPMTGLNVRIVAASEPHGARSTEPLLASQANPGAERLAPKAVAPTTPVATTPAKAEGAAPAAPQVTNASAGETANPERGSGDEKPAGERRTASSQVSAVSDLAKPVTTGVAMCLEDAFSIARPAAPASRPVVTDPFANVERVIEHLNAARQFDLSKPASISVAHREFGALTVTFDQTDKGMNVDIAAENRDAQRALAAAMANERGTARQQDGGGQVFSAANQHAASSTERSGSNGNADTTAGPNHGGSGNERRSDHSEQRGRQAERAQSSAQSPSPKQCGDGLYA